jgi:hypothetical protein
MSVKNYLLLNVFRAGPGLNNVGLGLLRAWVLIK